MGVEEWSKAVPHGATPHPNPPPAETAYTRVSATRKSDRNRQQPISIGGGSRSGTAYLNLAPMRAPRRFRTSRCVTLARSRVVQCLLDRLRCAVDHNRARINLLNQKMQASNRADPYVGVTDFLTLH